MVIGVRTRVLVVGCGVRGGGCMQDAEYKLNSYFSG